MDLLIKKLSLLCGLLFSCACIQAATPIVCDQRYALCTSARCVPSPENPDVALCECVTEQGPSVGFTSCEKRKPAYTQYKTLSLVSTFSFAQFATKKSMNCPKGTPWANCVDMPCTVDPQNDKRAFCLCTLNATQPFFTFGGSCNTDSCATGFWSGATGEDSELLRNALAQSTHSNVHPLSCNTPSSDEDTK
ncbi:hypothetical protein [Legionella shakespearei]|uniref:Uncharacterized protein n=1 Tax=Legionella shakespearei DSM 23087 TaxID=1122169 RepID=A0A0W0YVK9_9GAMM|nr:hypothetical protein [Legionella shakespearei]KTD60922.1 hypothetical protein Lsha_1333 [Legionella shakespearei DSM 23087]